MGGRLAVPAAGAKAVGATRRRSALIALLGILVWWSAAAPALANHTIKWGIGSGCGVTGKEAYVTVNDTVHFIACVTLDGEPLPGHQMEVRVAGPTKSVSQAIAADNQGVARFAVKPSAPGDTTVTLCDADGCVYGQGVIHAAAPATTTTGASSAATTAARAVTRTTIAETATSVTAAATPSTATSVAEPTPTTKAVAVGEDASTSRNPLPWLLIGFAAIAVLLIPFWIWPRWRNRNVPAPAAPPAPPPDEAVTAAPENSEGSATITTGEAGQLGNSVTAKTTSVDATPAVTGTPSEPASATFIGPDDCDWLVVYEAPTGPVILRHPIGRECCRFVIRVESTTFKAPAPVSHVETMLSAGAADVVARDATVPGPLQLPTTIIGSAARTDVQGVDVVAHASVSESAGAPVAVPGTSVSLGDVHAAIARAGVTQPDVDYRAFGPELAAASQFVDLTEIVIARETPCAPASYTINVDGRSEVTRAAKVEGAAADHGRGRTGMLAAAGAGVEVAEDLSYRVDVKVTPAPSASGAAAVSDTRVGRAGIDPSGRAGTAAHASKLPLANGDSSIAFEVSEASASNPGPFEDKFRNEPTPAHASTSEPVLTVSVCNVVDVAASATFVGAASPVVEARVTVDHFFVFSGQRVTDKEPGSHAPTCVECGGIGCYCDAHFAMFLGGSGAHGEIEVQGARFLLTRPAPAGPGVAAWQIAPA